MDSTTTLVFPVLIFFALIFGPTSCQQCDVVVTSQAALQEQIRNVLEEFAANGSIPGLITSENAILNKLDKMSKQISSLQKQISLLHQPGVTPSHPADSCADVLSYTPDSPSSYYWVKDIRGHSQHVYCDMTRSCGGVTGGWMRVAELNMTDIRHQCPNSLRQRMDSGKHTCGIASNRPSCSSVTFPVTGILYSQVCGKIRAYQYASTDAFGYVGHRTSTSASIIDTYYVDGISLTHGRPRQHIWTFTAALDEDASTNAALNCPCTDINRSDRATPPPAYVGNDYFCDTGSAGHFEFGRVYLENPLWDGAGCGPLNTCCSFNNPPWFSKQLPQSTTDDIEMRVCTDEGNTNEDIRIETVDIYVA